MRYIVNRLEDFIAGVVTAAIGVFIIVEASNYKLGSIYNMGAGYFPTILGGLMIALSLIMVLTARPSEKLAAVSREQFRGTLFVAAGFFAFAFTVEPLGLLASVFLVVFLSAMGNRNTTVVMAAVLALGTAVVSTLIFRVGLGLQIEAF
ncbi:tripartite tricarboxylate transporter TctB family protein [Thalassovita sp.]|uniref:tripartite tricarboxylate transporter TctB family protein n=1 Tax=Thalassovita sp. TaxID=1979401 RepID=UPI0029DE859D|nr:tripartite tricarboxylate transporter TctB family protein [Thalassovita sp.]